MKKIALATLTGSVLLVFVATAISQPANEKQEEKVRQTMELKLDHAQDLLEGLTMEDYTAIAKRAQDLSLLSLETSWQVLQTPQYARHSADFRGTVQSLSKAGKEKDLDAATLAYVEMTLQCVKCHKYVRSVKVANAQQPSEIQFVDVRSTHTR